MSRFSALELLQKLVLLRRCGDDRGEFRFKNGAILHYYFADTGPKRIESALDEHNFLLPSYDAVFANPGNEPRMTTLDLLESARALKTAGVPLLWLSTYDGAGNKEDWHQQTRRALEDCGVRFIPVHDMGGLSHLTKERVENARGDTHFCLPGPPSEIGVLLLKIAWALHIEAIRDGGH